MLGEQVPAAGLAELAVALLGLVVGRKLVRSLGDLHRLGIPKGEGVHRGRAPGPAGRAVAEAHHFRLARDLDLDRAAEAFPVQCFGHEVSRCCRVATYNPGRRGARCW